jgi:hypothetical protein
LEEESVPDIRDELRTANAIFRSARAQRRYLIWRAAEDGIPHAEIAEIVGVTRSSVSQVVRAINSDTTDDDFIEDEP